MAKSKMFKSTTIHHDKYEGLFSLSLDLKALIEGAIFVSESRLFQRLAPRYAKDFWPLLVLIMGIAWSILEFLNFLGCTPG